jgi:hypothetical protein
MQALFINALLDKPDALLPKFFHEDVQKELHIDPESGESPALNGDNVVELDFILLIGGLELISQNAKVIVLELIVRDVEHLDGFQNRLILFPLRKKLKLSQTQRR